MEWCASTEYDGTCNVVPMTSTPMQRLRGSDGLWTTYIGVGGLSIPPGSNVSLGLRLRSSTEQRSAWCWSAETMIGKAAGLVIRGLTLRYAGCVVAIQYSARKMWPSLHSLTLTSTLALNRQLPALMRARS